MKKRVILTDVYNDFELFLGQKTIEVHTCLFKIIAIRFIDRQRYI